ncbi:MAG: hypothetical protein HC908_06890 [Calothrix sp. SM1_7_51]|nr:hypothetical protein [Calothrix sp. SM1_7_51]
MLILLSDVEWSKWSNNEIAKRCGVGEWLVRKIKEELSSRETKIDSKYARKCGIALDTLKQAQPRIITQSKERVAQRNGTIYNISTANIGKYSKVSNVEKTDSIEVSETKVSELELISDDTPLVEDINLPTQQQSEEVGNVTIQLNNSSIEKPPESLTQLRPENINDLHEESSDNYIRIIKIKQDNHLQIEEVVQRFELNFSNVSVEIEGYPKILITLFQQMQENPGFTKKILYQAQLI